MLIFVVSTKRGTPIASLLHIGGVAMEIWKDIKGYEGMYQVSNLGRVKSLERMMKNRKCEEIIKVPSITNKGYYRLPLCKYGKTKYFHIHRLVAETFIPNIENKPTVDHIDRNKLNNNVSNLRWATYKEQNTNRIL